MHTGLTPELKEGSKLKKKDFTLPLLDWYAGKKRDLPWRNTNDPYAIWVSEVMLQQTRVDTVIPYYNRFISRFPGVHALARADLQEVLKTWEGLGYYARARNLHKAASVVLENHEGKVPSAMEDILRLPGVGNYIGAAVLSIGYGKPHPVVDANVKRVLARFFCEKTPVNAQESHGVYLRLAEGLLHKKDPGTFNQAVMELGALVCRPKAPDCHACPVQGRCRVHNTDTQGKYPVKIPRKTIPKVKEVSVMIVQNQKVLLVKRPENGLLGGLWEFPKTRVENGETEVAAVKRLLWETAGENRTEKALSRLSTISHTYTHFSVSETFFSARYALPFPSVSESEHMKWVEMESVSTFPLPGIMRKFLARMEAGKI